MKYIVHLYVNENNNINKHTINEFFDLGIDFNYQGKFYDLKDNEHFLAWSFDTESINKLMDAISKVRNEHKIKIYENGYFPKILV